MYGAGEPPHPVVTALSVIFGSLAGLAFGVAGFLRVLRNGKGAGTRAYASCGIAAILILFAGELTGTISVYPWHTRFYVVPGVLDRPAQPSPAITR